MNVFKGTLLRISQTETVPQPIVIANLDPSAENASIGAKGNGSGTLGMGKEMPETKEKSVLFVSPESE